MSSYRFCRTDDIGLLVDALNRCWLPHFPGEAPVTPTAFKRSIRDLQVWCSSCMVAFSGSDPIAVLIGAKRSSATLIHRIAVHPDHLRQGHGRHLLTSISSKLAILGPPRIVTELAEENRPARALFEACGYIEEARLTSHVRGATNAVRGAGCEVRGAEVQGAEVQALVVPVTVDDLAANGLFESQPPVCWERSVESLMARKDEIAGFAAVLDDRINAYILYIGDEIVALRSMGEDGAEILRQLLLRSTVTSSRLRRVHPAEISPALLDTLGFQPTDEYLLYGTTARSA